MKKLLYTFCLVSFFLSCKDNPEDAPCTIGEWEIDPAGNWYLGDMHVHATDASNDTGGDSYPEDIKRVAKERGLHFVVLTDHSNSTGSDADTTFEDPALFNQGPEFPYWDSAAYYSDNTFLMIDGNEISPVNPDNLVATGHIGCIPMNLNTFNKNFVFTDRPMGTMNGAEALAQASAAGCFKILNHPYAVTHWIAYDWTSYDYNAMEIWNGTGGYDYFDNYTYKAWICDLLAGRNVTPIGSSDCHRVNTAAPGSGFDPALGYPTTAVFAKNLSWNNIIDGLQKGDVSIFEGESRLYIDAYNEQKCFADKSNIYYIRIRGKVDPNLQNAVLKLHHYTSCTDPRPNVIGFPELSGNVLHEVSLSAGETFDISVEVSAGQGVYNAFLRGNGFHYFAISRAIISN